MDILFSPLPWNCCLVKAAFVPASDNALDTSYFISRFSWNTSDQHVHSASELEDFSDNGSMIDSGSCISNHRQDEQVSNIEVIILAYVVYIHVIWLVLCDVNDDKQGDECGGPTEFGPGSASKYSFSNFSFKVCLLIAFSYHLSWQNSYSIHNLA